MADSANFCLGADRTRFSVPTPSRVVDRRWLQLEFDSRAYIEGGSTRRRSKHIKDLAQEGRAFSLKSPRTWIALLGVDMHRVAPLSSRTCICVNLDRSSPTARSPTCSWSRACG